MATALPAGTTCDVYRQGRSPPAAPDVAGVAGYLQADYAGRMEAGAGEAAQYRFTHVLLVDAGADVRDSFWGWAANATADTVYIPDKNGTAFKVVHVEVVGRGSPAAARKVYLDRKLPPWPTNNL
jgi:hypothetical protein